MVRIASLEHRDNGLWVQFEGDPGKASVQIPVVGRFNALNAAAVCTAWHAAGLPFDQAVARLASIRPIAGRMQSAICPGKPLVVVDYAHTPDALLSVLQALQPLARQRHGRVWLVFGCGGDRDAGKRQLMGQVAVENADWVVLTSDNPRTEDPEQIIDQIEAGLTAHSTKRLVDRREAIETAVLQADANDVVLVAGKGHEPYQEINHERFPFSDWAVCQAVLKTREVMQ